MKGLGAHQDPERVGQPGRCTEGRYMLEEHPPRYNQCGPMQQCCDKSSHCESCDRPWFLKDAATVV